MTAHVLFLAPDTHVYNHGFLQGLKSAGARVSAIGPQRRERLSPACAKLLDGYESVARLFDGNELQEAAARLGRGKPFDRVETIDEPLVEPAARLREHLQLPGLSVATAQLCRDKVAMKDLLRRHGIACARSTAAGQNADLEAFAAEVGYPIIVKPIAGFGALDTHRVDDDAQLQALLPKLALGQGRKVAVEEFIDGHEGFADALVDGTGVRHDFAAHYYPGCLEASQQRWISPQIAVTNRIEQDGYRELRQLQRAVVAALGLRDCAIHMEWFFGSKGLKFSEIGARPAGEKIWDMYRVANEFDVYQEWALTILGRPSQQRPSRRYAAGSIQIRPSRDGRIVAHRGLEAALQRCGPWIYEQSIPEPGTETKGLDKGWLVNTWFRLRHEDYDELRRLMTFLGETVKVEAR